MYKSHLTCGTVHLIIALATSKSFSVLKHLEDDTLEWEILAFTFSFEKEKVFAILGRKIPKIHYYAGLHHGSHSTNVSLDRNREVHKLLLSIKADTNPVLSHS